MGSPTHYAAIDGLRGLAVLAVFGFHLDLEGWDGGYLGVDLFFLISGFIVTTVTLGRLRTSADTVAHHHHQSSSDSEALLLEDDTETSKTPAPSKSFDWLDFSLRRAKRLWPELYMVMFSSILVGAWVLWSDEYRRLPISALFQTFLGSNFRFWKEADSYFDPGAKAKPFLHTWSLSVEEQFYICFAAVLTVVRAWSFPRNHSYAFLLSVWSSSLVGSVLLATRMESTVFYLLPFRAWQFLSGVIPAKYLLDHKSKKNPPSKYKPLTLEFLLFGGILLPIVLEQFFVRIFPVLPAAIALGCGAPLLVSLVKSKDENSVTWVGAILGVKPLVMVGEISYSIYLWHWPAICFAYKLFDRPTRFEVKVGILLVTMTLAALSHHGLTTPLRAIPNSSIRKSRPLIALLLAPILFFIILTVFALLGHVGKCPEGPAIDLSGNTSNYFYMKDRASVNTSLSNGSVILLPKSVARIRPSVVHLQMKLADRKIDLVKWGCPRGYRSDMCSLQMGNCSEGVDHAMAMGDSHILVFGAVFEKIAEENNICLHFITGPGCPPFIGGYLAPKQRAKERGFCIKPRLVALELARKLKHKMKLLILGGRWELYMGQIALDNTNNAQYYGGRVRKLLYSRTKEGHMNLFTAALNRTMIAFHNVTEKIAVISQVPVWLRSRQPAYCKTDTCPKYDETPADTLPYLTRGLIEKVVSSWKPQAHILDPAPVFCRRDNTTCNPYIDGVKAYHDQSHLNRYGAKELTEILRSELTFRN